MFKTLYCNRLLILVNNGLKFVWGAIRFATKTQTGLLQKTFQLPISLINLYGTWLGSRDVVTLGSWQFNKTQITIALNNPVKTVNENIVNIFMSGS